MSCTCAHVPITQQAALAASCEELLLLLLRHLADVDLGALALALACGLGLGLALALGRGMQKDPGALLGPGGRRVDLQVEQVVDGLAVYVLPKKDVYQRIKYQAIDAREEEERLHEERALAQAAAPAAKDYGTAAAAPAEESRTKGWFC